MFILIIDAINEYHDLKRELTTISRRETRRRPSVTLEEGGEKATKDEFNLTEFMNGFSEEASQSGIKLKRLGIVWKNLVVKVKRVHNIVILWPMSCYNLIYI